MTFLKRILITILFLPSLSLAAQLTIGVKGEELKYDKQTLTVKAGETVELTFKNTSKQMPHNFVLLAKGSDYMALGMKGIQAGPTKNYVPESDKVLAHTKLLKGGESETIKFTAPKEPGDYPFVCTFPGHPGSMNGILKVTK